MKQILLFPLLVFAFSFSVQAQTGNNFKAYSKKQSGTTKTSLNFNKITGKSNLKSATVSNLQNAFSISQNLKKPEITQNKVPRFLEKEKSTLKSATTQTPEEQFYVFHNSIKQTTRLSEPSKQLKITGTHTDNLGITHIKAQQYFKGIIVYGAESFVHIGSKKDIFNGYIYDLADTISTTPNISKAEALHIVSSDLTQKTVVKELSVKQKEILEYDAPQINLIIYANKLAYEISIRPNFIQEWKYFIDAQSGAIIKEFNNTHSDGPTTATAYDLNNVLRTIDTYLESGTYLLVNASETMYNSSNGEGAILTYDANNTNLENVSLVSSSNNTWNNKAAVSAHYYATLTYKYLENTFNRNSINDEGGNIIALVNLSDELGGGYDNAYWNGKFIALGTGGDYFYNLAGGLDVVAHEIGHGVVENTANLEYYGQSGAINETYADIFGAMVDREDWFIGEDITKTSFSPSGAMRNMSDPHNSGSSLNDSYWQPNHTSQMYIGEQDNGGVHINSGIGNYAYYLYATSITKEKAEQVFYRALTNYLTSKSQFIDLRIAVIQAAKDLYGDSSSEVVEAGNAFDAVGIYDEESIDYAQNYPVNPGQDYLLTYDTDLANSNTLYRSSITGSDFYALSTTEMKGSVSVSDDGSGAVFVATDDKIKVISTDPNDIQEFYLSDEAFFDNVAISKDGNRLAAISTEIDTAIYVYDFISAQWSKFSLYNPTTSHIGSDAGGVLFADAIEFDHTGEYLIYDAFNELNTSTGNINYWDIGFIKVWDNATNEFGDGTINKLYGSLPENVSIGNPTFSKNSPYIIAFDYLDSETNEYAIFGANLLTGDLDLITTNATIGYPTYSKNDDKIAFSALNMSDEEVVASISLATNKITGLGSASIIVSDAKWPVFYAVGNRSLDLAPIANFTADVKTGETPFNVQFMDLSINNPSSWNWTFEGGTPSTSNLQNPTVTYNSAGIYQVSLTCTNNAGNNTITKTSYISVSTSTAVDNLTEEIISFFPNPTSGILNIETNKDFELELYSTTGSLLIKTKNKNSIDLSSLNNGLYILTIKIDDKVLTNKIIKE